MEDRALVFVVELSAGEDWRKDGESSVTNEGGEGIIVVFVGVVL